MLGIIISAGIASGLALTLASVTKEQQVVQRRTETYFEINNLSYLILRTLEDAEACTQTLGPGTTIRNSSRWSSIKNKDGGIVLDKTEKYGNNLIKIKSIAPKNIRITETRGEMSLQVTFKKLGATANNETTIRNFPLSIDVDSAGKLIKCRSNNTNIVTTAKERMCLMLDGSFDFATETCDLAHLLIKGQKEICNSIDGVFDANSPSCDVNSFVQKTVKSICTSVQGTFNETTGKCSLSSSVPPSDEEDDELLKFNDPYRTCRIGFGAHLAQGPGRPFGKTTFSTCFGPEVSKLFQTIKSDKNITIRTAPWISHWFQYNADGGIEQINFYRRPGTSYNYYRNILYFVNANPKYPLLPMYQLVTIQIKMKYAKTGEWYTFTFSKGMNYPNSNVMTWVEAEEQLKNQGKDLHYEYKWLEPWP